MFRIIREYLLYLFVFFLPWQTRWIIYDPQIDGGVWEYGRISIYGFDVIFFLLLIYFIVKLFKKSHQSSVNSEQVSERGTKLLITHYSLLITFISLFLYFFISIIFWSDNKILSFYWSLRILEGIGLVWILSKINFSQVKLAGVFVSSVTLSATLGIYQFLTQSALASKWLGLAYHSASVLGDSVIETATGRWLRAYGSFPHPNVLAGFIVVAIIFCLWLASQKAQKTQKTHKALLLYYFITSLLITALFFTFSRAAWLIFFITLLLYYFIIKDIGIRKKLLSLYLYIFISLLFLSIIFWPLLNTRWQMQERLEVKSNVERVVGYSEAWQIIKAQPVLGLGLGNYTVELQKMNPNQPGWTYQPVHNVYLLVLAEFGLVGFLFISLFLYFSISALKKLEIRNLEIRPFVLMFFCFIVLLFFDHFFWTLPSGLILMGLMIGLARRSELVNGE